MGLPDGIRTTPEIDADHVGDLHISRSALQSLRFSTSDSDGNLQDESELEMKPRWHGWDMYHNTYKANLPVYDMNEVRICSISPDFNISEILGDDKVDGKMMRTYDSLTLKEQLLLKCSSVLGDLFSRAMLIYMIPTVTQLEIAQSTRASACVRLCNSSCF